VQVVTATHQDLVALERDERFRSDLLARLSGFTFELPALRERREDLGLLIAGLLTKLGVPQLGFSPEAVRALFAHHWPKNIRELERALQVGAALAQSTSLELDHLPPQVAAALAPSPPLSADDEALRQQVVAALELHRGNLSGAARAMGKARVQLQRWVKRFGLNPDRYR
jgi:transcriptional regulator of acetoin/glycerol metabolism